MQEESAGIPIEDIVMPPEVEDNNYGFGDDQFDEEGNPVNTTTPPTAVENPDLSVDTDTNNNIKDVNPDSVVGTRTVEAELIASILKEKNFNPEKIKVEDENGEIQEQNFFDMSKDDQLAILKQQMEFVPEYKIEDLGPEESDFINFIRENNFTINDVINAHVSDALNKAQATQIKSSELDNVSDEDVYIAHMQRQFPDMTEDEIRLDLENAQSNEDLFAKKIQSIRTLYNDLEAQNLLQAQMAEQERINNAYADILRNNDYVGFAQLDDQDKNQIYNFMTNKVSATGQTALDAALEDPDTKVKVAWFIQKGPEFFNQLYDNLIKESTKSESKKVKESKKAPEVTDEKDNRLHERLETAFRRQYPAPKQTQQAVPPNYPQLNNNRGDETTYDYFK